jgi:hypothetical protein
VGFGEAKTLKECHISQCPKFGTKQGNFGVNICNIKENVNI